MSVYVCNYEDISDKNLSTEDRLDIYLCLKRTTIPTPRKNMKIREKQVFLAFQGFLFIINKIKTHFERFNQQVLA